MTAINEGFDNRRGPARYRLAHFGRVLRARARNLNTPFGGDLGHFWFEAHGKRLIYCYINKNACSAFKKLICETSPFFPGPLDVQQEIEFLSAHHSVQHKSQKQDGDISLFVYRDPHARFASTVVNKLIMRSGAGTLLKNISTLTGKSPGQLSVAKLIESYIAPNINKRNRELLPFIDQHFLTQSQCLAPIHYDLAIPLEKLSSQMHRLVGPKLAEKYFSRPANESVGEVYSEDVSDVPFEELWARFDGARQIPSKESIVGTQVKSMISEIYTCDLKLFDQLEKRNFVS